MAGEWRDTLLQDLADELTVGFVGSMTSEYVDDGIPFFRSKNVNPYKLNWDDLKYVSRKFHEKIKKSSLGPGDVVIVRTGKPGTACMIPDEVTEANCSDLVIVRPGPNLDKRFLVYFLNSAASHHINANLVGAVQQHFNVGAAKKLNIPLPPLHEQKAIAHVLGSLDDKIELNRRMNETLEGMAQALFKSWFVDFDPVIDNALAAGNPIPEPLAQRAETRRQALANGTANRESAQAFPTSFRFTEELGWIPEGWEAEPLGEIASILNGYAFQSGDYTDSGIFVLRTKNFDNNGLSSRRSDDVFLPESFAESHSTYLSQPFDFHLVMVGASIGKTSLLLPHLLPALRNQNMWCFRPNSMLQSRSYLNLAVQKKVSEVMTWASGSARSFFRKGDFKTHKILVPSENLLTAFEDQVGPMFLGISNTSSESETLAKLRDVLLPKLISGELRIPQAEKIVEEAIG